MASRSQLTSVVELHESEKPQPLRIIKRSQTVTGGSASREMFGGRGLSGCSDESFNIGSPPFGADRPLTVHKIRKKRGSILNGSLDLDDDPLSLSGDPISDLVKKNDTQTTDDSDTTPKAQKTFPRTISAGAFLRSELLRGSESQDNQEPLSPPKIPERRRSKSKNFILKAMGNLKDSQIPKAAQTSTPVTTSLPRRLSRVSRTSTVDSYPQATFADSLSSAHANQPGWILVPDVKIVPEVTSITGGHCTLWVAVTVTGKLCQGDGSVEYRSPPSSHLGRYGELFSLQIDLLPAPSCVIPEVFGSLSSLKNVRANETHLVLVKLCLSPLAAPFSTPSDRLIADLENHLGNTLTPYLTVRLTCKHSGFENEDTTTVIQSETTGSILRNNPRSVWAAPTQKSVKGPANNPLITLVEQHLPVERAREAIHKLAAERIQIPYARRNNGSVLGSSQETVKALTQDSLRASKQPFAMTIDQALALPVKKNHRVPEPERLKPEIDPARKIWSEMRRTSRGRHQRRSISAGTFSTTDDSANYSPGSRRMSDDTIDSERTRIKEQALKNKRSVGADTLRSIAPSVAGSKKGTGTVGALGLGRNWGWGGTWW